MNQLESPNNQIIVPELTFFRYQNSAQLSIYGNNISICLISDLVSISEHYLYIESLFKDRIAELNIIPANKLNEKITITKKELTEGLKYLTEHKMLSLSPEIITKLQNLRPKLDFNLLLKEFEQASFEILIDKVSYSISYKACFNFLQLSEAEYQEICTNDDIKTIEGIPKNVFIYAVSHLDISDNYDIPRLVQKRLGRLKNYTDYDTESLNLITETKGETIQNAHINPELKEALTKDIPTNYNPLEKAIYIYFKMCDILSYDEEFFATNEKGKTALKHADINHISTITPENNLVVCYEFNAIYAKMLEELNINYEIISSIIGTYGRGHAYLEFRYDKFLIRADAVAPFFKSDIFYIKINELPNGLKCYNSNTNTRHEFNEILKRVYNDFRQINPEYTSLKDALSMYQIINNKIEPVPSIHERIEMFYAKIRANQLIGIDRLSYLLSLHSRMFTLTEKRDNFLISIVRNKRPDDKSKEAAPEVIIAFNEKDFYEYPEANQYYLYKSDNTIEPVSKEYLLAQFYSENYSYTESTDHFVPGI